jgi:hypothetical protein
LNFDTIAEDPAQLTSSGHGFSIGSEGVVRLSRAPQ